MKYFKKILLLSLALLLTVITLSYLSPPKNKVTISFLSPLPPAPLLRMAIFSDIHSDTKNLKKAIELAKSDQIEMLIITGDLTTLGKKDELLTIKNILEKSGLKYFVVPGNHDLWWSNQIKKDVFGEVFGQSFNSFVEDDYKLIFINNGNDLLGVQVIKGTKGQSQLDWLEVEISDCPQIYCLVFMHEPLNHPYSSHTMGEADQRIASEAAYLIEKLVQQKVKEVFAGHIHSSYSYEIAGLKTTIVGALTQERNLQSPRFLEIMGEERKEIILTP